MEAKTVRCCDHCGAVLEDDALFCPTCGYPVDLWQKRKKQEEKAAYPRKNSCVKKTAGSGWNWKRTAIAMTAAVLIFALAAVLVGNYFAVLGGPLQRMAAAVNNTIRAESFTVDMTLENDFWTSYETWYVQYNLKHEDLLLWMTQKFNNISYSMAICDGYKAETSGGDNYSVQNVQRGISFLFDMYRESGKLSFRKTNWQNALERFDRDVYREITRVMDMEQAERDLQTLLKRMNSKKWMKENAGYSCKFKNGVMTHTLRIDPYTFLMACLECFEDAFYSKSDYYAMQDEIEEMFWNGDRIDISLSVKNGKIDVFTHASSYNVFTYAFRGVGRTVVDEEDVRAFCDRARRA